MQSEGNTVYNLRMFQWKISIHNLNPLSPAILQKETSIEILKLDF